MRLPTAICLMALTVGGLPVVSAQNSEDLTLTVYNAGTALIRDQRQVSLDDGLNTIVMRDIAKTIDPTSVNLRPLNNPNGITLLEQSYIPDRYDASALLARYLGETVSITADDGALVSGELLRVEEDTAVLRTSSNELAFVRTYNARSIQFPSLPADLEAEAGLRILIDSANAGHQDLELSYLAGGMNWTADYSIFLAPDESSLDLKGMVTLTNTSGRDFSNFNLKLVAGEVSRIEPETDFAEERMMAMSMAADASSDVEQRGFSEYRLYQISRPVSIQDRETKQIEFVSGRDINADISYVYDSSPDFRGYYSPINYLDRRGPASGDIATILEFATGREQGLGADLPAGRARVYQADADGASLLIGESQVQHTPEGEAITLHIGNAFDLTGQRVQSDFTFVSRLVAHEKFEIRLRNRKEDQAVEIIVPERLYRWRDWQIIESSLPFVKVDSTSIEFAVTVEPGAEEVLTYTVRYSFPEEE